jgi:hypothetical protein
MIVLCVNKNDLIVRSLPVQRLSSYHRGTDNVLIAGAITHPMGAVQIYGGMVEL